MPAAPAAVDETKYRGQSAITLRSGTTTATFLPHLGLTGVSLVHDEGEYLAVPGGVAAMREGRTTGLPLVAPWVNRLDGPNYRVGRIDVDLSGPLKRGEVRTDDHGLPIHGLISGRSDWTVERFAAGGAVARLDASLAVDDPAFPFPHRIDVRIALRADELAIDTTVVATGKRRVPVAFGWHPYLTVPGTPRARWRLRTPEWAHLALDRQGIPIGAAFAEPAADEPLAKRTFDDLYALAPGARGAAAKAAFVGEDGRSVTLRCGEGYTHAQVWVPAGKTFAALEPMAAATNALATGDTPFVKPGESFTASFALAFTARS